MAENTWLQTIVDKVQADTKMVFGEPVRTGERTIIPLAHVSYGFGAGTGPKSEGGEPGGGGGGVRAKPAGFIDIGPEGVRFVPAHDAGRLLSILAAGLAIGWWLGARTRR
jgi:uncharacterized spore protein YtfJ